MEIAGLEKALADKGMVKVVQMAPAVRVGIGEMFGYEPGTPLTKKLVGALRALGFDYVFDTTFGADIVVMEENLELEQRHAKGGPFPLLNSCCPGFVLYLERNFPDLRRKNMATVKSPMETMGALVKSYFAQKQGIDPRRIYSVAAMPCLVKKMEARRPEMLLEDGLAAVDYVITTNELGQFLKSKGIDLRSCEESDFDKLMGQSSGAARIFGASGGVSEATLRYHAHLHGKTLADPVIKELRGFQSTHEIKFTIEGEELKILVIYGLQNAAPVMKDKALLEKYHFIEVMTCPGGCIGGAGQPPGNPEIVEKRRAGLYSLGKDAAYPDAGENPQARQLYDDFLGPIGGQKARRLLHIPSGTWEITDLS